MRRWPPGPSATCWLRVRMGQVLGSQHSPKTKRHSAAATSSSSAAAVIHWNCQLHVYLQGLSKSGYFQHIKLLLTQQGSRRAFTVCVKLVHLQC